MAKLAVSIVNFNSGEFLKKCLESLLKIKNEADLEIWIVDNNSSDNSMVLAKKALSKFPRKKIILNKENLGFGRAQNQALKEISSDLILVLNPDSEVLPGTIQYMANFMEKNQDVGAASCKIVKADGSLDIASHRGFPTPWASFKYYFLKDDSLYHLTDRNMEEIHEVDSIVGAFFLTRKSILEKVGFFDEDYFLYAEDIDLCFKIKEAGYKVMYVPTVKIIHHKGVASGLKKHSQEITTASKESREKAFNSFYKTMKIFYRKHLAKNYPFFINWLVYLGINLKWWLDRKKLIV